jgi:DNA-binding response OmpR family regulator
MRPRKTILVVNADEVQLSVQKFALETNGYRVLTAQDADAAGALHALGVDLVLGFADGMLREWEALAERMKAVHAETPILLVTRLQSFNARMCLAPRANFVYEQTTMADLYEWVRTFIPRKRGPRRVAPVPALAVAGD